MNFIKIFLLTCFFINNLFAFSFGKSDQQLRPHHFRWGNMDIVWIEDNSVPTFSAQIYFSDGALSDAPGRQGETDFMFTGLFWGTNRFNQKEIGDNFEYFGTKHSFRVLHEYSMFSFGGLNKDLTPITKKFCHLFSDSVYPRLEIKKYTNRMKGRLANLVTNHSALADHTFRRLSLRGTNFEYPSEGTLKTIGRIKPRHLKEKKDYFNKQVKKKLYLRGNKNLLRIKDIILGNCGWGTEKEVAQRDIQKVDEYKKFKTKIVLIPVNGANQAQIRIGRFFSGSDVRDPELLSVMSGYIGGNFISVLNHELRTKKGLVYSVSAYGGSQKYYGRSVIRTSSRNEKVNEALESIKEVLKKAENGEIDPSHLQRTVQYLKGGHLFQFESYNSFLRNLMFFDHVGREWSDLYAYPSIIEKFSVKDVSQATTRMFNWDKVLVVIVGDKSLRKQLQEVGSVQTLNYKKYL